jgi:hypothetical protein
MARRREKSDETERRGESGGRHEDPRRVGWQAGGGWVGFGAGSRSGREGEERGFVMACAAPVQRRYFSRAVLAEKGVGPNSSYLAPTQIPLLPSDGRVYYQARARGAGHGSEG